ncbi:MAG: hypothetical protein ACKO7R_12205 [Pseudanabaena sp.]
MEIPKTLNIKVIANLHQILVTPTTKKLLKSIKVNRFLDIGAGAAKYGKMVSLFHPNAEKIAVEIDETYVKEYKLHDFYNQVWVMPASKLIEQKIDETYDLVIIGDCIEHMRKSEGLLDMRSLLYRCNTR